LADGELAINLTDERLYFKNAAGTVKLLAANLTAVANGGTGRTTLTANNILLGNGTGTVNFVAPGTAGNVLTSNGTTWTSAAASASLSGVTQSVSPFETALGHQAGNVTTGINNSWIGYQAGLLTTSGTDNTAVGYQALRFNTTGNGNAAIGSSALRENTTGNNNIGFGVNALITHTTGENNLAIGNYALQSAESSNNSALGYFAGGGITTGTQNTLLGSLAAFSGVNDLTTGSNNIIIGFNAAPSSATVSNEVTIGNTNIVSTRLRGMVELNASMFERAFSTSAGASGTVNYDARNQSVLYYTSNASGNWTLNIRAASGVSLDSVMTDGESMTVAFLVTNGATAFRQTGFQIDGTSVTPRWQGGTAPAAGNANSIDAYVITVIKRDVATFTVLASQTRFA
jgi:hypothetical protein